MRRSDARPVDLPTATQTFDPDRRSATFLFNPVLTPAGHDLTVTYTLKYSNGQYTNSWTTTLLACGSSADYGTAAQIGGSGERDAPYFTQTCSTTSSGRQDYVMVHTAPGVYGTADDLAGEPVWDDHWIDGATSLTPGVYGYGDAFGNTSLVFRIASPPTGQTLNVQVIVRDQYGTSWPEHLSAPVAC